MPSSRFLVHWTGQKDFEKLREDNLKWDKYAARLKDWYQIGLFAKTADAELIFRLPEPGLVNKFKMKRLIRICLTEIRLSQAKDHSDRYGKLGIGFTREFIANKGGRPVMYTPWEAKVRLMEESAWRVWQNSAGNDEIREPLTWLLAFFKVMSNGKPEDSRGYEDYYEEMEWRLVFGESLDHSGTFTPTADPDTYRVTFEPNDVTVIVFPHEEVLQRTLNDSDMKRFFAAHQPDLVLLKDCKHF